MMVMISFGAVASDSDSGSTFAAVVASHRTLPNTN
jgi:hypothetical protein